MEKNVFEKSVEALAEWNANQNSKDSPNGDKKSQPRRTRAFALTSYIDIQDLETFLRRSPFISHYALICHDADIKDDGTPKEKHNHVIIYTYDAKTCSSILKHFDRLACSLDPDNPQNTLCQECHDVISMWRYLRHADDRKKHQYPLSSVICDDLRYWQNLEKTDGLTSTDNKGLTMVQDLLDGVSYRTMCERYGKEYIYHQKHIEEMCAKISWEETSQNHLFDESMFRLVLSAEYTEYDIQKFMSMLAYVKNCFSVDLNNGKAVDIYLKG